MRADTFRALGFALVAAVLLPAGALVLPRLLDAAGGAEVEVAAELKDTEPEGLSFAVPGSDVPARSHRHSYARITMHRTADGRAVEVGATLDFTGAWGGAEVSSLGLERLRFEERDGRWRPVEGWAPSLAAVLARLETRRKALEAGDVSTLSGIVSPRVREQAMSEPTLRELLRLRSRRYRVQRWYLRFERDEVWVNEEGQLSGDAPDRPLSERVLWRLRLAVEGKEFFFSPSLM